MNIPERIDSIVAKRQLRLSQIVHMQQQLELVNETVRKLDEVCQEAASGEIEKYGSLLVQHPEIAERLRSINTKTFHDYYEKVQNVLRQLHNRFSRQQIHISFVGRAGQGKSLIMQNISGLSGDIIPSSDGADCTGAKSIITNCAENNVTAEITFYTHKEYVDIVNKYLQEIFGAQKYEIDTVDQIANLKQKELHLKVDNSSAKKQTLYLQLEKYIEHSTEVIPMLGTVKTIPSSEIESYVAQYSSGDKSKKYWLFWGDGGLKVPSTPVFS